MKTVLIFPPLLSALILSPCAFSQGPLTPPGPPAPTMKTLNQIEARTPIDPSAAGFTTPYNITQSGSYYLTGNINISNGTDAIRIAADNVTLDLNGFALVSTSGPAAGIGVNLTGTRANITVRNGSIRGQVTVNSVTGTFSGGGFSTGIFSGTGRNFVVREIQITGILGNGIDLTGDTTVDRCMVSTCSGYGIFGGVVSSSSVSDAGGNAIAGSSVSNSIGIVAIHGGSGIVATTVENCRGISQDLYGISAQTVTNCYGESSIVEGILADVATGCRGKSGSGRGVFAQSSATNCSGLSNGNDGIKTDVATGCKGESTSGIGLNVQTALNSEGLSSSGIGLKAALLATNCRGISTSSTGLDSGAAATTCFGGTSNAQAIGCKVGGTANACVGQNTAGGVAIQAFNGIGCGLFGGTSAVTNKFLGTP